MASSTNEVVIRFAKEICKCRTVGSFFAFLFFSLLKLWGFDIHMHTHMHRIMFL